MAGKFSIEAIFKAKDRFTRTTAKMSRGFSKFARKASLGLKSANNMAGKFLGGLKKIGVAAAAVGVAVGAGLGSIIKTGSDFEQAITNVGAVGLQTRDQIASLEKKALDLGSTTKFTATEAANAMEVMARAGFKNEEILSGVDGVLSAAAASGLELAEVANHVSNVLKGMGLEAGEASRVADVLALASSRTNSSIGSLGESMKNLAPVARQMNIPMEEAVAAVALLQDVGLDASEAGTATATMLTKLAKPSSAMAKQMKELGISFQDAAGNALPLPDILGQFDAAAKKSGGNMDVVALFAEMVGLRGQKAALNLKEMFASGKMSTLTKELQNAEGAAKKMADIKMDTLQGDWTLFESAVDGVKVALFGLDGGALREIVQGMTKWVEANKDLIISGAQEFIKDFRDALPTIVYWMTKIGRAVAFLTALAVGIKVVSAAVAALNFVMALNPVGAIILGIVTLTALLVAFWPEISDGFWWLWGKITDGFDWLLKTFSEGWEFAKADLESAWMAVKDFFGWLWEGIKDIAFGALELFLNFHPLGLIIKHWTPIKAFFAGLWDSVKQMFFDAIEGVMNKMRSVVSFFSGMIDKVKGAVGLDVGGDSDSDGAGDEAGGRDRGSAASGASVVSPAERVARSISESRHSETVDVNINDNSGGKATVSRRSSGRKPPPGLQPSGAF